MFAEFKRKASGVIVRLARTTCILVGGSLVLGAVILILTPLMLGLVLLALASRAVPAQSQAQNSESKVRPLHLAFQPV